MIQYSRDLSDSSIGRGILDSPLQPVIGLAEGETRWRGMTRRVWPPYSAGLAGVDTSVPVAACEAAAFFSTIATAMIEPS